MERASRDVLPSRSRVDYSEGRTLRFEDFDLRPEILKALADLGYEEPTPIQEGTKIGRAHV